MAYNNNNNKKRNNNNEKKAPKPVTIKVPMVITGQDVKGVEYDRESCVLIINDLADAGVFEKLSYFATAERKLVTGREDDKGTTNIARIAAIDNDGNVDLTFFGKNIEIATNFETGYVLAPRVRVDRNTGDVISILSIDLIPETEA